MFLTNLLPQEEVAKLNAANSADRGEAAIQEEQARLQAAEASMEKLLLKVDKEKAEVADAVAALESLQGEMNEDPMMGFVSLKEGGIVKQASLVGGFLFTFRAIFDAIAILGPNAEAHAMAAGVQGIIGVVCLIIFFLS